MALRRGRRVAKPWVRDSQAMHIPVSSMSSTPCPQPRSSTLRRPLPGAAAATGGDAERDFLTRRLPDLLLFGLKLATLVRKAVSIALAKSRASFADSRTVRGGCDDGSSVTLTYSTPSGEPIVPMTKPGAAVSASGDPGHSQTCAVGQSLSRRSFESRACGVSSWQVAPPNVQ
jgi:hypothetical protein